MKLATATPCGVAILLAISLSPSIAQERQPLSPSSNQEQGKSSTDGGSSDSATPSSRTSGDSSQPPTATDSARESPDAASASSPAAAPATVNTIPVGPESTASDRKEEATALEDIVVTSTKRERPLREIPSSISYMDGKTLEDMGAQGLQDYLKLVPGVTFGNYNGFGDRVTVRGVAADLATSSTTGIFFGDVSFNDAFLGIVSLDPNPFDLRSVEVLKGPVGTLFGASALNGAVRFVPEPPDPGAMKVKYFAQYSAVHDGAAQPTYGAALNVPIGSQDNAAVRVVGFARKSPGYVDNLQTNQKDANEVDQTGLRGMFAWDITSDLKASLMHTRQTTDMPETAVTDNRDGRLTVSNRPQSSPVHTYYDLTDLGVRYDLGWAQLVSDTAAVRKKFDGFYDTTRSVIVEYFADRNHTETYSQELRLVSPSGHDTPWSWVTGLFGTTQKLTNLNIFGPTPSPVPGGPPAANFEEYNSLVKMSEKAWFGEVTRQFWSSWEATLGGRLYKTKVAGTTTETGTLTQLNSGAQTKSTDAEINEQGINPKASITWHATPNIMVYVATAKGFRVGGLQTSPSTGLPAYKSDYIWSYEAGLRTQWFDNTLRFDVTPFYEKWIDPQLIQEVPPTNTSAYYSNVGGAKSVGIEPALVYLFPIEGLSISASAAFTNTVTTAPFKTATGTQTEPGRAWPFAPRSQAAATLNYVANLGAWSLRPSVTYSRSSKAWTTLDQTAQVFGYGQWDMQLGVSSYSMSWMPTLTLVASNLTDVRGITMDVVQQGPPTYDDVTYVQPRSILVRLGGEF